MRISDWSSDVCSSDLAGESAACAGWRPATHANAECADHERRSAGGMTMLKKDFGLSVKDVSDEGTFEGYASTFGGSPDSYGDVVLPGAFAESLVRHKREGTMPLLLWGHNASELPIGNWVDMAEDGKGLWGKAQIDLDDPVGQRVHKALKRKSVRGLSIGYETIERKTDPKRPGINLLEKLELWEVRSEEHTSELQSLMRISYAVLCLKKKKET